MPKPVKLPPVKLTAEQIARRLLTGNREREATGTRDDARSVSSITDRNEGHGGTLKRSQLQRA